MPRNLLSVFQEEGAEPPSPEQAEQMRARVAAVQDLVKAAGAWVFFGALTDPTLDPALVDACTALFLPDMPEQGRAAGIVGPAVPVAADASPQDRLLGAMGRHP